MAAKKPKLELYDLLAFVAQAWTDGVRRPCFAYQRGDRIVCYRKLATIKRLAHEYEHWRAPDAEHEPWYAFDVFSYNPIRLQDRRECVKRAAPWLASLPDGSVVY